MFDAHKSTTVHFVPPRLHFDSLIWGYDAMQIQPQVDQMITSQLGSLNTAAPTGPVWREPKLEQMKEMEEGKKEADELAPMYMEGSLSRNRFTVWTAMGLGLVQ